MDKLSEDKLSEDKISEEKLSEEKLSEDKLSEDKISEEKPITNEDIMKKLILIEDLILAMNKESVQIKQDTTKMSDHINTIDTIMTKIPLNWLPFKLLKS